LAQTKVEAGSVGRVDALELMRFRFPIIVARLLGFSMNSGGERGKILYKEFSDAINAAYDAYLERTRLIGSEHEPSPLDFTAGF
jgi:hypothetical protein